MTRAGAPTITNDGVSIAPGFGDRGGPGAAVVADLIDATSVVSMRHRGIETTLVAFSRGRAAR